MEGSCSTGQSPQWAVVPVEEEEEEEELRYFAHNNLPTDATVSQMGAVHVVKWVQFMWSKSTSLFLDIR
jgi:hypothetical protein